MSLSNLKKEDNNCESNVELHYETIEYTACFQEKDGLIKEILDIFVEPKILKKYIYKAPIIGNDGLSYGYKIKLIMLANINIEFTQAHSLDQSKVYTTETLFNVSMNLPSNYEDGKNVSIEPSVIDVSHRLINMGKVYMSTYLKFTVIC